MSTEKERAVSPTTGHFVIPSLDGLRAISFLLVFAGHTGAPWIPAGFGVTVFFFLSGYLITTLMRLELERTGSIQFRLFYLRRVLRIWPPFYLVLFAGVALTQAGVLTGEIRCSPLLAQIFHAYNYWTIFRGWQFVPPGSGVYWSLAVEEHFYLLFPALFYTLHRAGCGPRGMRICFLAICAVVLAWRFFLVLGLHVPASRTFVATDCRIDSILFGCCLAVWRNPAIDSVSESTRPRFADLLGALVAVGVLLFTFLTRAEWFRETVRYSMQSAALTPLFSFAVRFPAWGPLRILNTRPLKLLGALSYSMYLMHHTLLDAVYEAIPGLDWPARAALAWVICFLCARLLYIYVEKPCAILRTKLVGRVAVSATAVASGT